MLAVAAPYGPLSIVESATRAVVRLLRSIPRLPVILVVYIAVIGYVYKRLMRDLMGVGTKKVRILGKMTLELTKEEEILSASVVDASAITDTFETVGGLAEVKQVLTESVVWPYEHPELFERNGLGDSALPTGVLLHGPPGTGKTLLARALAKQMNCFFIEVSAELLFSKYVGESEKLAAALFSLAHKLRNCVIFVDEIDSLLAQRTDHSDTAVFNHTKTLFMTKWDGLTSTERKPGEPRHRVLVLGATNRAQVLDEAITRRLPIRLLVPLPDRTARKQIIEIQFKNLGFIPSDELIPGPCSPPPTSPGTTPRKLTMERSPLTSPRRTPEPLIDRIATETQNYSGSDIRELCKAAVAISVRDTINSLKNPSAPVDPAAAPSRQLQWKHFEEAFKRVHSSSANGVDDAAREMLRMLARTGRR